MYILYITTRIFLLCELTAPACATYREIGPEQLQIRVNRRGALLTIGYLVICLKTVQDLQLIASDRVKWRNMFVCRKYEG